MIGIILGFCLGVALGSFVKVLADRSLLAKSHTVWYQPFLGRSYCPKCKKTLRWYDLFPIFSYLVLRGKCRFCQTKISFEYPLVELVAGILIAYIFWIGFDGVLNAQDIFSLIIALGDLIYKTFFVSILLAVTLTDLRKTLIPDRIMYPSIVISISYLALMTIFKIYYLYYHLANGGALGKYLLPPYSDYFRRHALLSTETLVGSIVGAIAISSFFLLLILITKGRGMGGGDVKLGFFMGLGLGFSGGILATVLAFFSGAVISLGLIVFGKKKFGQNIPFGPFLVLGSIVALFWEPIILGWYFK